MVKITLEYGSVEEAIQALGKLSGLAKVRRAAQSTTGAPTEPNSAADSAKAEPALAAPTKQRKPRNDAGKPRGSYKKAAPATSADADGSTQAPEPVQSSEPKTGGTTDAAVPEKVAAPSTTPHSPGAASPTEEEAKMALEAYFDRHGPQKAMAVLAGFGVSKLRELPADKRARFIEECKV